MKIIVTLFIVIYMIFMGSVLTIGFVQKQQKEAAIVDLQKSTAKPSSSEENNDSDTKSTLTAPSTSPTTQKLFTASQVASHNKPADCWLIISGTVYNITSFLDQHPAGADVILPYCGKDATNAFETQDRKRGTHSQTARKLLQGFEVGTVQ